MHSSDYPLIIQAIQGRLQYLQFGKASEYFAHLRQYATERAFKGHDATAPALWISDYSAKSYHTQRCEQYFESLNTRFISINYRLTDNIISNLLQKLLKYSKNNLKAQNYTKTKCAEAYKEGVSTATNAETQSAETHMAQARKTLIAGALAAALGAAAFPAAAQEQTNTAEPKLTTWTEELRQFDEAANAASDYAENNDGVGILIHVGTQVAERRIEHGIGQKLVGWLADPSTVPEEFIMKHCVDPAADEAEISAVLEHFAHMKGVEAQYFLRYNDVAGTGVTFHINHLIHDADKREELKPLIQGICAVPDVAEALPIARAIETSSLRDDSAQQTASLTPVIE